MYCLSDPLLLMFLLLTLVVVCFWVGTYSDWVHHTIQVKLNAKCHFTKNILKTILIRKNVQVMNNLSVMFLLLTLVVASFQIPYTVRVHSAG